MSLFFHVPACCVQKVIDGAVSHEGMVVSEKLSSEVVHTLAFVLIKLSRLVMRGGHWHWKVCSNPDIQPDLLAPLREFQFEGQVHVYLWGRRPIRSVNVLSHVAVTASIPSRTVRVPMIDVEFELKPFDCLQRIVSLFRHDVEGM